VQRWAGPSAATSARSPKAVLGEIRRRGANLSAPKVRPYGNAIAIADDERGGEVRFLGEVDASEESMRRVVKRIAAKHSRVQFRYKAGPTGSGLHRLITSLGHSCIVVAPSLVPRRPGDQVKTNRRDAISLAKLLRAGELTAVGCRTKVTRRCVTSFAAVPQRSRRFECIGSK
jgi:hypothetical protein